MKTQIRQLLTRALEGLVADGKIAAHALPAIIPVERSRREGQGDYASGVALISARAMGVKPRDLAAMIRDALPANSLVEATEIAGPGFINFYIAAAALTEVVSEVLTQRDTYGTGGVHQTERILLEYVSANPTGPLHVGHGRGAAYGDTLARLLRAAGHHVETEYYVNDIGRQMDILSVSVWVRYMQSAGVPIVLPKAAYQGDYVIAIANRLRALPGTDFVSAPVAMTQWDGCSDDELLDAFIRHVRNELGGARFNQLREFALTAMINVIRTDLETIGVLHDTWFFESQVMNSGELETTLAALDQSGCLYQKEGATWFRSSDYGDEKDRVLRRSNGELTYFATDIAYHLNKLQRGYDRVINVWGADHHGYIARMKAAVAAAGESPERLHITIVQFATLWRGKEKIPMSTRAGEFVSLAEMVAEIGRDATRFFYASRKPEQHLDFDLELAKSRSNENPVYYVQYAHARVCSVLNQLTKRGIKRNVNGDHSLLNEELELNLIKQIAQFPEVIASAAQGLEPHQLAYYLRDLATDFHTFYNRIRILDCAPAQRDARLNLIDAVRQVLVNGLDILGVSAPEAM